MQECARVCQSIPEYARQRRANNSVFEYYSNNIRIPKYSYSYSGDFFKPNNIRIRIRSFFGTRIIFVFVFGPQNTIRSPLDWTQVLSPPKVGEAEVLSGHACRDMLTSKTFVDLTYHRKFSVKVPGVTVRAYTARGTLQASGQDIYCYGSVGRALDGTTVRNSMVFVSYRVTTGTLEGRREVRGARRAVITSGPLNGVEIDPKQAMGNSVILGSVTIVLDANFQDNSCPLARIKKGLEMFVLPRGGEQLGELSMHPGDKMYSVNGHTGTPPGKLQNYTILITGSQDLVLNLGQERKLPASCGSAKYIETSHSHVLATIDEKDEETVEYLPLDLELVEATAEYSARLDLLSYITQQTLANIEERLMSDTCIGDPEQLASLLEKASLENDDRVQ